LAITRSLERHRPLHGAEDEFLALVSQFMAVAPEQFTRVWSDPEAYAWTHATYDLLGEVLEARRLATPTRTHSSSMAERSLRRQLDQFKPFALAMGHHAGVEIRFQDPVRVPDTLAIPSTPWHLLGEGSVAIKGCTGDRLIVEGTTTTQLAPSSPSEEATPPPSSPLTVVLHEGQAAACEGLAIGRATEVRHDGFELRLQPFTFVQTGIGDAGTLADLGQRYQGEHVGVLREALGLVRRYASGYVQMREWMRVVAFKPPGVGDYANATSSELPGATILDSTRNPYELAENFIHEFYHTRLFVLEDEAPLFQTVDSNAGVDFGFYSPWREDPRPLKGLLHAMYVFVAVGRFWLALTTGKTEPRDVLWYGTERLARVSLQLSLVQRLLRRHARFSDFGERLFSQLSKDVEALYATIKSLGASPTCDAVAVLADGSFAAETSTSDGRPVTVGESVGNHLDRFDCRHQCADMRAELGIP
jgi:HEXXH motif-containing protein